MPLPLECSHQLSTQSLPRHFLLSTITKISVSSYRFLSPLSTSLCLIVLRYLEFIHHWMLVVSPFGIALKRCELFFGNIYELVSHYCNTVDNSGLPCRLSLRCNQEFFDRRQSSMSRLRSSGRARTERNQVSRASDTRARASKQRNFRSLDDYERTFHAFSRYDREPDYFRRNPYYPLPAFPRDRGPQPQVIGNSSARHRYIVEDDEEALQGPTFVRRKVNECTNHVITDV